ncbi:MAG TPA: maleylpyruvate isomerase family mycothiol-dependent enzyme [Acidimicrobiales bacterium]|nr:maleylpyruvate isomerase family mycothiol-dependent enzyme [Acidimicrobiales bacterium]
MKPDPVQIYRDARGRVVELVRDLDEPALAMPVPACPGWAVRDLLCHMVGLPADVNAGRVEGAGTDPWTAAQLASRSGCDRDTLLAEWEREAPAFEQLIPMIQPPRPVFDIVVHEQDMRGALGVPGARDSVGVRWLLDIALDRLGDVIDAAELPALEIAMEDEGFVAGSGDVVDRWDVERFELFRSVAGRRSAAQIEALGCPVVYVKKVAFLPMAPADVIERL